MIDDKKIQKGMKACLDRRIDDKVERENMRDPLIAYTRAFDDAIDWFKNVLWHDASEEPKECKYILVQWLYEGRTSYETDRVQSKVRWQYRVAENNIIKWCYIEDILPKGGEK